MEGTKLKATKMIIKVSFRRPFIDENWQALKAALMTSLDRYTGTIK